MCIYTYIHVYICRIYFCVCIVYVYVYKYISIFKTFIVKDVYIHSFTCIYIIVHVCGDLKCVCVHIWVYSALHIANMWEYIYIIVFFAPLLNSAVPEFRVCVLNTYLCVYIYTCVRIYTHAYTVCTYRGMRACKRMHWFTHTHPKPGTHPCVCMYVCAPCLPRHDSP